MRTESAAPAFANMSAPPRSTVMLPRLAPGRAAPDAARSASPAQATAPLRSVPVGPGGGKLLSNALCVARVDLPTALCAHLRMSLAAPVLTAPMGLARALVAIARRIDTRPAARDPCRAARLELGRVAELPEGALIQELTTLLESIEVPAWVPQAAFVLPLASDIAMLANRDRPPAAPEGVACPLLAARLVAAIRGPVFLRKAAPGLSNLMNLQSGAIPSRAWDIWLPVEPGRVQPLAASTHANPGARP